MNDPTEHATPPLPRPAEIFVGRGDLIRALAEMTPEHTRTVDVHGIAGSGKTKFLLHACQRLAEPEHTTVLTIPLGEADQRGASEIGGPRELSEAYARFREVLSRLVEDVLQVERRAGRPVSRAQEHMQAVKSWLVHAARAANPLETSEDVEELFGRSRTAGAGDNAVTDDGWLTRQDDIIQTRETLAAEFAAGFALVLQDRQAIVTIDDFEYVAEGTVGRWLLDVTRRLARTLTLLARTPTAPVLGQPGADLISFGLPPLTTEDIREVLETCLPGGSVDSGLVEVVERFSDGHAHSVGLAADLLQSLDPSEREPAAVDRRLADLPPELEARHADLVTAILDSEGPEIAGVVKACCTLRSFDADLLEAVLDREAGPGADLVAELQRYTFIEPVSDPRGGFFRVHEFIRSELDRRFEEEEPGAWRQRHRRAAAHLASWLNDYEEGLTGDGGAYGVWYRYEQPDWQAGVREWLYHEARGAGGTDADRRRSRLRFARIVLDAFWWWGCYIRFPFISDLLDDWRRTQDDGDWVRHLTALVDAYPTGYKKDPEPERWRTVRSSLLELRSLCGIPMDPEGLDEDQRHVHGISGMFLAHSWRYSAGSDERERSLGYEKAAEHYDEAVRVFRDDDAEEWDLAWALFERAELHVEHGGKQGSQDWREAARLAESLKDDELAANLHRLAADAVWPGSPFDAFAAHGRAVLSAYLFQGRYQGMRYRPDQYTRAFYFEQVDRAVHRLIDHARAGGDVREAVRGLQAALPAAGALTEDPAALCSAEDRPGLALLFPAPPAPEDLGLEESAFMTRWVGEVYKLGEPPTSAEDSVW